MMREIWDHRDEYDREEQLGQGLPNPVVIPSDPNALIERMDLLFSSKNAGHSNVRNELVGICDELLRQNVFSRDNYEHIMTLL